MKQLTIKSLLATLATPFLLASCNVETSGNGSLDGFWHLERVDTLATGGTTDYSSGYVFWGVQKDSGKVEYSLPIFRYPALE